MKTQTPRRNSNGSTELLKIARSHIDTENYVVRWKRRPRKGEILKSLVNEYLIVVLGRGKFCYTSLRAGRNRRTKGGSLRQSQCSVCSGHGIKGMVISEGGTDRMGLLGLTPMHASLFCPPRFRKAIKNRSTGLWE